MVLESQVSCRTEHFAILPSLFLSFCHFMTKVLRVNVGVKWNRLYPYHFHLSPWQLSVPKGPPEPCCWKNTELVINTHISRIQHVLAWLTSGKIIFLTEEILILHLGYHPSRKTFIYIYSMKSFWVLPNFLKITKPI